MRTPAVGAQRYVPAARAWQTRARTLHGKKRDPRAAGVPPLLRRLHGDSRLFRTASAAYKDPQYRRRRVVVVVFLEELDDVDEELEEELVAVLDEFELVDLLSDEPLEDFESAGDLPSDLALLSFAAVVD